MNGGSTMSKTNDTSGRPTPPSPVHREHAILGTWTTAPPATGVSATTRPRSGGRSPPSTSWRSWPSTTPASETGEKGAILRREGLYSSLITDWRRQHRQGLLKAAVGRSDGGRGGPSLSARWPSCEAENERLRTKLAQAEAIIEVQGKVHALLEEISKSAATDDDT